MLFTGCASIYEARTPVDAIPVSNYFSQSRPDTSIWYRASVDIVGKHLSGLLLVKSRKDSARLVFTNESGFKFFDLEFGPEDYLKVHSILPQMDKKSVIRTLQNDFLMAMGYPFRSEKLQMYRDTSFYYLEGKLDQKRALQVFDIKTQKLDHLALGSKRKNLVSYHLKGKSSWDWDSIVIQHHNFDMKIELSKLSLD